MPIASSTIANAKGVGELSRTQILGCFFQNIVACWLLNAGLSSTNSAHVVGVVGFGSQLIAHPSIIKNIEQSI